MLALQMDYEDLFHTIKTNPITLKHLMSKEFNELYFYSIDLDYKCALS
jgi:hypothetical protein